MIELKERLNVIEKDLLSKRTHVDLLNKQICSLNDKLQQLDNQSALETATQQLLILAASATWTTTKQLVEGLVTRAMQAIFSDRDYKFIVKQEIKRNAPAVTFAVLDNGMELDLVDELGGGICDMVAMVLRIAFLSLCRPKLTSLLVLDEPLKHLAANYQPAAGRFLKQVCHELGIVMLITTHSKELSDQADQLFRADNINGICSVEEEIMSCSH